MVQLQMIFLAGVQLEFDCAIAIATFNRTVKNICLKATTCRPYIDSSYTKTSNLCNITFMDKHSKIIKRQRARLTEPHTNSTPTSESSFALSDQPTLSAEPADQEQFFESMEPPMLTESWSAVDRKPSL